MEMAAALSSGLRKEIDFLSVVLLLLVQNRRMFVGRHSAYEVDPTMSVPD
jgi:hypothetical protein